MKIICLAVLVFTLFSFTIPEEKDHDIHVSVCELLYNESSGAFEVSVKIFIDDLELALARKGVSGLHIGLSNEDSRSNEHIASYLQNHLRIRLDDQYLAPEFLGKELSDDYLAVWCYLQFPATSSRGQQCRITNDILLEVYDDQKNLTDIRMNKDHREYTIFQNGRTTWSYTF